MKKIAIIGNPNSGKTSLFNNLTGYRHHVGNWPGKTVEKKQSSFSYENKNYNIIDLPGTYDLESNSAEEAIVDEFFNKKEYDLIVNIVNSTTIERNLFLTLQLIEKNEPLILALNFNEDAISKGQRIDIKKLSNELGVPIVRIEAISNIENIKKAIYEYKKSKTKFKKSKNSRERYDKIKEILDKNLISKIKENSFSDKIDRVVTNKFFFLKNMELNI